MAHMSMPDTADVTYFIAEQTVAVASRTPRADQRSHVECAVGINVSDSRR